MATGPGNTRQTARTVVLGPAGKSLRGLVTTQDPSDFWKFKVGSRSNLNINLKTLSTKANTDLQLMTATGRILASSRRGKNLPEKISNLAVEAGTLIVRVLRRAGTTRYALSMQATAIPAPSPSSIPPSSTPDPNPIPGPSPIPDPNPIPGPSPTPTTGLEDNTIDTSAAFQASTPLNGFSVGSISNFVGDADTEDYFKITPTNTGTLKFQLSGLQADADIQLFDANRTLIAPAAGDTNDSITKIIGANEVNSTFYIRVLQAAPGQNTNYTLDLSVLPTDTVGNDVFTANVITFPNLPNGPRVPVTRNEFVGGGDFDVYTFELTSQAFFGLDLENLGGNADVSLHRANPPGVPGEEFLLRSVRPGNDAEQLGGTLNPGTYFLRISTPGDLTPSPYNLTVFAESTTGIPTLTRDIIYGQTGATVENLTNINGTLFFSADNDEGAGKVLWKSTGGGTGLGGTLDRTSKVSETSSFTNMSSFVNVNNTLYFAGDDGTGQSGIWKSDGNSIQFISSVLNPTNLTAVGNTLYFIAPTLGGAETDLRLWSTDGTTTAEVANSGLFPTNLVNVAGTLFYVATDSTPATEPTFKGRDLWRINSLGQAELIDINQDSPSGGGAVGQANLSKLTAVGDSLYLVGVSTGNFVAEAMRLKITGGVYNPATDLTVFDADNSPFTSSLPNIDEDWNFVAVGDTVYFATNSGSTGELYKVENNAVSRVRTGANLIVDNPRNLTAFNGKLLFRGTSAISGKEELWITDGTDAGTIQLTTPDRPANAKPIDELIVSGTKFYFTMEGVTGNGDLTGKELWTSDGTVAGTKLVYDIFPGFTTTPSDPNDPNSPGVNIANSAEVENLTNVNGQLFFTANNGVNGQELWSVF